MTNKVADMFLYNPQNFAGNEKGLKIHEQIYPLSFFRDDTDFFPAVPGRSVQIRCPAAHNLLLRRRRREKNRDLLRTQSLTRLYYLHLVIFSQWIRI